jgi:hypothetical protein
MQESDRAAANHLDLLVAVATGARRIGALLRSTPPGRILRHALDTLIALELLSVVLVILTGGFALGGVSIRNVAKPVLILVLAIPIRLALGERTWLARGLSGATARCRAAGTTLEARLAVWPAIRDAAVALAVTRVATVCVGLLASMLLVPSRSRQFDLPFEWKQFAHVFAAWDSGWYFDIARQGYYYVPNGQSSIAFFPLYPLLIRWTAWPFGGTDRALWMAAVAVSLLATFVALVALHRLTERMLGSREIARRTVLYVCVFPFSLFLSRVYAEGTFLLCSVLAVSLAYQGRWWLAGAAGAFASLARPNGILIGLPLLILALRDWPRAGTVVRRGLALALLPASLGIFCWYVWTLSGDPFAWLAAQERHWGYSLGHPPWQQLLKMLNRLERYGPYGYFFVSEMAPYRLLHGTTALLFLALTPFVFKRLGAALGVYVLVSLLVPLSGNALEGIGRYSAVLFPAFMAAATMTGPRSHEVVVVVSSVLLAAMVVLFVTLHPVY